jgi:hypothetical protein
MAQALHSAKAKEGHQMDTHSNPILSTVFTPVVSGGQIAIGLAVLIALVACVNPVLSVLLPDPQDLRYQLRVDQMGQTFIMDHGQTLDDCNRGVAMNATVGFESYCFPE